MLSSFVKNLTRKMSSGEGIKLKTVINYLESFAPKSLSEKWDNTGLLLEPQNEKSVVSILLTNDLTEDVVKEALDLNTDLIVSYHPPIFRPFKSITTSTWKERVIGTCIENKIAVYSPHTSWDSVPGGVNDWLASAFDVSEIKPINENLTVPNAGAGRHCTLKSNIKISQAVENVKKLTGLKHLKLALARNVTLSDEIQSVGICAGSGGSLLSGLAVQLFLTGEMSHHELLDANHNGTSVILCNHSDSERGFLKVFAKKISENFQSGSLNVLVSEKDKDPIITI